MQYHMMMTYYKVMKQVRKKVELEPASIRKYMKLATKVNAFFPQTKVNKIKLGKVETDHVPCRSTTDRLLFFVHGGAFVFGSSEMHHPIAKRLSRQLGAPAYIPAYRQAPEHTYPIPLEDCFEAYEALAKRNPGKKIIIIGDSAGGNLAASLCLKLKQTTICPPDSLILFSPWLDLHTSAESVVRNKSEESLFDKHDLLTYASLYIQGHDPDEPLISPLRGDLEGMPRTLIQVAENELLFFDGVRFAEKLERSGVDVVLQVEPNLFHSWQLAPSFLPAAKRSLDQAVLFLQKPS